MLFRSLLEKYTLMRNRPYREWDFDFMASLGFDYVRLPLDYRIWTTDKGGYREAQHDAALAWMKDSLENWQKSGWGWCL